MKDKASKIKLLLLDVDGVMTDGSIILDNNGNELKRFHVRDGHGIR
ncbi:MAG TPA: phenylphosphate carboxylase subunit delta, partial [Nitrospirae bacterium]|nr:phenylphosphate carboxylase subunit delta [Nitrospirota bacterium]